jgi:chromosome segregation ATPase
LESALRQRDFDR